MTQGKKVFIRTFGCQMNEYDSAKMADVLAAAEGFEQTPNAEDADLILFNTCSVREKAQEKVFADLGRVRALKQAPASRDDRCRRLRREPGGRGHRAPRALRGPGLRPADAAPAAGAHRDRRATGKPQVDISFPEIEKFDHLPPARVEGASAFVSIMEGCSKYCSFCVVPYTRGEEVSRPLEDILAEVRYLASRGVLEVTLLGQNVNAYRGVLPDGRTPISRSSSRRSPASSASSASATPPRIRWNSRSG
jgi:tRNA-2-methylthio-N6-dimethylallyladenosine synthase